MIMNPGDTIPDYISRLRQKAEKCEFAKAELSERLIEMVILATPHEDFRRELLSKPKHYSITDVLAKGQEYEAIQAYQASLTSLGVTSAATNIDAIRSTRAPCGNCGRHHPPKKCPAYHSEYDGCGNKGHWKQSRRKTTREKGKPNPRCQPKQGKSRDKRPPTRTTPRKRSQYEVRVHDDDAESEHSQSPYSVSTSDISLDEINQEEAIATVAVHYENPSVDGPTDQLLKPEKSVRLTSYSGHNIKCLGSLESDICRKDQNAYARQKFCVIDVSGRAIHALPTCELLGLVELSIEVVQYLPHRGDRSSPTKAKHTQEDVHQVPPAGTRINTIKELQHWFPDCFDRIGRYQGEEQLHLKNTAEPFIDPPRRWPIHLREQIGSELQRMKEMGIICPVQKHTGWCSSLTYAIKQDGSLRVSLDPQKLNSVLKRCPHKIPTVEEITSKFSEPKYFTKLDANSGY